DRRSGRGGRGARSAACVCGPALRHPTRGRDAALARRARRRRCRRALGDSARSRRRAAASREGLAPRVHDVTFLRGVRSAAERAFRQFGRPAVGTPPTVWQPKTTLSCPFAVILTWLQLAGQSVSLVGALGLS